MTRAIFGATGSLGKALAAEWARARVPFRVVGRSEQRLRSDFARYGDLVEYCVADFADPRSTTAAAEGVDTIIYLAGVPYTQFALHPKLTRTVMAAAASSGVRRFLLQGTVYPFGIPQSATVSETHPRNPHTFKGQMRKEQEDIVLGANGRSGLRTAILRAPDFYGPDAELSYAADIFKAAVQGRRANVIGPIDTPHEFIYIPDLAKTISALSEKDEAYGSSWNVAGPGIITVRRFAELVFAEVGRKPSLRVAGKTALRLLGIFNPFLREVLEMQYLWTNPVLLDDSRLRVLLGELPKTPYEEGIRGAIASLRAGQDGAKAASA